MTGAQNEFVAFQVAVESETPVKDIAVTIDKPLFAECKLPPVFQKNGAVQLYREWMVPDDKDTSAARPWYPDPLIPMNGAFDLPAADNGVPHQRVQPVFVDIYIPHDAAPGVHQGSIAGAPAAACCATSRWTWMLPFALPDQSKLHRGPEGLQRREFRLRHRGRHARVSQAVAGVPSGRI
jgi:hypothetical protein